MASRWGKGIRAQAQSLETDRRISDAMILFALPLGSGVAGATSQAVWNAFGLFWAVLPWLILLGLSIVFWLKSSPTNKGFLSLAIENDDLRTELEEAQAKVKDITAIANKKDFNSLASFVLRSMSSVYVANGIATDNELNEMIGEVMTPLYIDGALLGFDGSEYWAISVYLYSRQRDLLIPVWREKSRNHPSKGAGREWGRGQGHVGKAFVDVRDIVTRDATNPEVAKLSAAPNALRFASDDETYRSFAAIPVVGSRSDAPFGVLVATSNRVGRFDEDSAELLKHFAHTIGVIIELTDLDIDCLPDPTGDTVATKQGVGKND